MKKKRSLRATLLRVVIIPAIAVMLILLGITLFGANLIRAEILDRQKFLIDALARQSDQYLSETDRLMHTLAYSIVEMPPEYQAEILAQTRANYSRFNAFYLLDETGRVLIEDTDAFTLLGLDLSGEQFYRRARDSGQIFFSDPFISLTTNQVSVTGAMPILDGDQFRGMLVGELNLALLQQTIEQIDLGKGAVSFIVDQRGTLVAHPKQEWVQERRNLGNLDLVQEGLAGGEIFKLFYDDGRKTWVIGSVTPMTQNWIVITTQPVLEVARPLITLVVVAGLALGLSLILSFLIQVYSLRQITAPISVLAQKADALARGEYEDLPIEQIGQFNEIISLGTSFTRMVEAVQERDRFLEQRVADRTRRLEIVATVGERINAILDPGTLLTEVVNQIQENLGYYSVNIFLLDDARENLVLRETIGKAGTEIKEQGISIPINATKSLVARALRTGKVVKVDDVHQTTDWLSHPLLPNVHSELAVPIIAEDQVTGVLDVQENEPAAFDSSETDLFRSLANQIGVALYNARLYTEMERLVAERTDELVGANEALEKELLERRRAEEALQRERDLVARIMETSPVGITMVDRMGKVIFANNRAEQVLGLTKDEITQRTFNAPEWHITDYEGTPFPDRELPFRQVMSTGRFVSDVRHAIQWPDGRRVLLSMNAAPLFDKAGQVDGMVATVEDITERVRAEAALRESEAKLQSIFRAAPIGIGLVSDRLLLQVNNRICEMIGYTNDELVGQNARILYPTNEDYEYVGREKYRQIEEHGTGTVETRWQRKDGSVIDVLMSSTPIDLADFSAGVTFSALDITARQQAEKERSRLLAQIQQQAQRMQQIMDTVPEGVLLLDVDGRVISANPVAEDYLIVLSDAKVGAPLAYLGDRPLNVLLTSPPQGLWHEVKTNGQSFQVIARPIETGPTSDSWVLVLHDSTQEREIQQRAQQQERLAAVGQLAAGIAHDFNNIMAVIVLYTQIALTTTSDLSPKSQERLRTVIQQAKQASELIQQILDFSRRAVIARQPLNLAPLLKEQIKLLERTLPENIQINLDPVIETQDCIVNADPTRMQQMIMNLALNARDAMPKGGKLYIELAYVQIAPGDVPPLPEIRAGAWVRITIKDTGTGIPSDVQSHIFDPFFTTKAPGQGTGLGLAQVYGIVKQHEGEIGVKSQLDQGTTFSIYLPALSVYQADMAASETHGLAKGAQETVLVVEDDKNTREALAATLETLNYRVLAAANGRKAMEVLQRHKDQIALVLSDVVMPEMGGIALFHTLRQKYPKIQMVLLTGHPMEKEMDGLSAQGLASWLPKPPKLEQLAQVVARVLADGKKDNHNNNLPGTGG